MIAPAFRSPLRGARLTSILGTLLLAGMTIVILTGFLSHTAYQPSLQGNAIVDPTKDLPLDFAWPTSPVWLYALTQGLHVSVGYAVIPILLAKLWSVMPRLFAWPPVTSAAMGVERLSIALLVSSSVFQLATGVANAQYWYPFRFNFVVAHYWGAVVFTAALVLHVAVKFPVMRRAYRTRREVESHVTDALVAEHPAPATISRRGLLAWTGAGAGLLLVANGGQALGGPFRELAVLAPRNQDGFPVNKTFRAAAIPRSAITDDGYRLLLRGGDREVELSRTDLLAMEQRTETLPIACVEGWTATRDWTGVPLADLARLAGFPDPGGVYVESLQPRGILRKASLNGGQVRDPRSLLALQVQGRDLSLDHGFPARIIVPALPGVHNTKWVGSLTFRA